MLKAVQFSVEISTRMLDLKKMSEKIGEKFSEKIGEKISEKNR